MTPDNPRGPASCQEALPIEEAKLLVERFKGFYGEPLTNWAFNFVGSSPDQPQAVISTHHHPQTDRLNFIISGPVGDLEIKGYNGIDIGKDFLSNYWGLRTNFLPHQEERRPFSLHWFNCNERAAGQITLRIPCSFVGEQYLFQGNIHVYEKSNPRDLVFHNFWFVPNLTGVEFLIPGEKITNFTKDQKKAIAEHKSHVSLEVKGDNLQVKLDPPLVDPQHPFEITFPRNITYQGRFIANRQNLI